MKNCKLDRGICSKQCGNGCMTGCMQDSYCENQIPDIEEQAEEDQTMSMYEKGLGNF